MQEILYKIHTLPGTKAKKLVDSFYQSNGSDNRARDKDLFFLALTSREQVLGCVRYCIEGDQNLKATENEKKGNNRVSMLRSMMVDSNHFRLGIGQSLLNAFERYLNQNQILETYCVPYGHLEKFYSTIGFFCPPEQHLPVFLKQRLAYYRARNPQKSYICMKRLHNGFHA